MTSDPPESARKGMLKRIAEVLSVITASAFLTSAIINSVIFLGWGVVFLSIATPTDVVMSGLQLLIYSLVMLLYVVLFATIFLPDPDDVPWRRRGKALMVKAGMIASGSAVFFFGLGAAYGLGPQLPFATVFQIMAGCALTLSILMVVNDVPADGPKRGLYQIARDHMAGTRTLPLLSQGGELLFGGMFAISGAALLASTVAIVGFVPQQTWYDGPGTGSCAPLHVLWIGQSTLLVECPADRQVRVIARGGDGILRVSDKRPPAFRQAG